MSSYVRNTKTANYTIVSGDLGKIIDVTSNSVTISLTAAATLGDGFYVFIRNSSSTATDVVTIDGNGSETIDGTTSITLRRYEGIHLVCDGSGFFSLRTRVTGLQTNFSAASSVSSQPTSSGSETLALGYQTDATGNFSTAIGYQSQATADAAVGIGYNAQATYDNAIAIGNSSLAMATYAIAMGGSSQTRATGSHSVAIGSYANASGLQSLAGPYSYTSGRDSVALGIAYGSTSYGAHGNFSAAIGQQAKTTGSNSVAIGKSAIASGQDSFAFGRDTAASGGFSLSLGKDAIASASGAVVISAAGTGYGTEATGQSSIALGDGTKTTQKGQISYASHRFASRGDGQGSLFTLYADTTDATATVLTTDNGSAGGANQIVAASDTCIMFSGTLVATQNGAQDQGGWEIKGLLKNDGGTTTLVSSNIQTFADGNSWVVALTADNTNNALAITCTGEASHNIRWVANIQTSQVTYAQE